MIHGNIIKKKKKGDIWSLITIVVVGKQESWEWRSSKKKKKESVNARLYDQLSG